MHVIGKNIRKYPHFTDTSVVGGKKILKVKRVLNVSAGYTGRVPIYMVKN